MLFIKVFFCFTFIKRYQILAWFWVDSSGVICVSSALPRAPGGQCTLGILKVVGHRQAATAIRTTFPGGPKSQKPMDGRQKPFCGENKVD